MDKRENRLVHDKVLCKVQYLLQKLCRIGGKKSAHPTEEFAVQGHGGQICNHGGVLGTRSPRFG